MTKLYHILTRQSERNKLLYIDCYISKETLLIRQEELIDMAFLNLEQNEVYEAITTIQRDCRICGCKL